jgi:AcrR family transcriptional regulator
MLENRTIQRQVVGKRRQRKHVQERGNIRRQRLLSAAEELLGSVPVEALSFKAVCVKAGVPESSAYHFFANRYDLMTALTTRLAEKFSLAYKAPVAARRIQNWRDVVDLIIDRAVEMYQANPAAVQVWLSGRTPAEVRLADHVSDKQVSHVVREVFEQFFELPDLPGNCDIFFYFMELSDLMLSLSVIEHGEITENMVEESKRAGKGYLANYLPPVLERIVA